MPYLEYISFFSLGIYSLVIFGFTVGWFKLRKFNKPGNDNIISASVVVACRNEEKNLDLLLESLISQNYPKNKLEILIVDDHSEDNSVNIIENYTRKLNYIKLLRLPNNKTGKKEALSHGVKNANSKIILTTDADCLLNINWIASLISYYQKYKPQLISGPVSIENSSNLFQKIQSLEFLSLIASGAGAIGVGRPIMNNGANLLFERSLFMESNQYHKFASGDDIFLMLHAKKTNKKSVHFIKSKDAIVYTQAAKSCIEFFNQRIRWTSKSKVYKDLDIIITAIAVVAINLIFAGSLILSFWNSIYFGWFLRLFLLKSLVDLFLLIPVLRFFSLNKLLWLFLPLQIIYPFYILLTFALGLRGKFLWKNRTFKEKG
ncbi:MAG: hypothetical protein C0597_06865 [Marinilabiliales bacterium]|nr:MAG: hypothetical protein C0597_06865 [Marinilabiliales bacterium]